MWVYKRGEDKKSYNGWHVKVLPTELFSQTERDGDAGERNRHNYFLADSNNLPCQSFGCEFLN